VPVFGRGKSRLELKKIQGFRKWGRRSHDAGRFEPSWDAGMAPQERGGGWSLMIFLARATRALRRASLNARSRRSFSPHPEEVTSKLGWIYFYGEIPTLRGREGNLVVLLLAERAR